MLKSTNIGKNLIMLVTGGQMEDHTHLASIEMFHLIYNLHCTKQPKPMLKRLSRSTGGILHGNIPIVCGGLQGNDEIYRKCFLPLQETQSLNLELKEARIGPAGIVINSTTFFITGGIR